MGVYRTSRSIEASIIQYTEEQLASSWSNVIVEKSFKRVYSLPIGGNTHKAIICIRCGVTVHDRVEIGSNSTVRNPQILIDLFCDNDGQRLDLKDFLIGIYKGIVPYYEYTITAGTISAKILNGNIRILEIDDEPVNFDTPKDELDIHDRYRHLITLSVSRGRVEV